MKTKHNIMVGVGISACFLVTSCANVPSSNSIHQDIKKELSAIDATPIPKVKKELEPRSISLSDDNIQKDLVAPMNIQSTNSAKKSESRFDVSVTNLPARDFFMGLVADTDTNLIVHPDITGNVSINLKNVTLEDVLKAVRDLYGFSYEKNNYGYHIYPQQLTARVYHLSYLNVKRMGSSRTNVSNGERAAASSGSSNSGGDSKDASSGAIAYASEIQTESQSDFWSELDKALKVILADKPGRNFIINPQAGIVVVRAQGTEHKEIENFLKVSEASLQKQVILEAKILEVELNNNFQSGINWTALGQLAKSKTFTNSIASDALAGPKDIGGVFKLVFNLGDFDGVISLLEDQGQVKVLSSPRIATVNNQKAVIKVGQDEFFVTGFKSNVTTDKNGNSQNTPDLTLSPFFSGIALDVTPQISVDDEITLHVHPSVSEVNNQTKDVVVGDKDYTFPVALSKIRESDSIVHARSEQIIVIGGLLQNTVNNEDVGIPVLSRIPGLGYLFKQKRQTIRKSELVILLKPIVSGSDTQEQKNVKEITSRLRSLEENSMQTDISIK